ncbi:TonB-dependent receptor [Gluconacetobacter sacchari DSM 12717]|nr:TonB-dependent receptor [Gluconacetobacter sacchari DSM 12717]
MIQKKLSASRRNCYIAATMTALVALATSAHAASGTVAHKKKSGVHHKSSLAQSPVAATAPARAAGPVAAQAATAAAPGSAAPMIEGIMVSGRHSSRGAHTVLSSSAFDKAVPGTSVLKILQQIPGVAFVSDDPQGLDTGGMQIFMHGFSQNQLGFTLDGIPLGEPVYRNYNGLNTVEAISSENVDHMNVTQGAGDLSMPSTNSLGGGLEIYSSNPKDKLGGLVSQTFGSNATYHTFVRIDSGKLTPSGTKFFVSYMRNDTDKWKGYGDQFMQQVNAKLVQPIGNSSSISVFYDYSDLSQYNYQDISLNFLNTLGQRVDNYYPNYKAAYLAAQGIFTHGENLTNDPLDVSFYSAVTQTVDQLGAINAKFQLTDNLHWDSVVYGHGEKAATLFTTPYLSSPNGAPLSDIIKRPTIQRFGFTSALTYEIAKNTIHSGIWFENNKYVSNMYAYQDPLLSCNCTPDPMRNQSNPFEEPWGQTYNTDTFQFFLEDTWRPIHNLTLHAGFKSLLSTTHVSATANDPSYTGTDQIAGGVGLTSAAAFLPHISADYVFLHNHEVYFDIANNMRAYPQSGFHLAASPFAVSQAAFDASAPHLHPETDWAYNIGYRYTSPHVIGSINLYHADFANRLQGIYSGSLVDPQLTVLNVGSVTMNGLDADLTIIPVKNLRIFNSVSFNKGTYQSNLTTDGVTYDLKGKKVIDYPSFMYKSSVDYTFRKLDAHFDVMYMGRRPFSYTNDVYVPGYWLASVGANYNFGKVGFAQNLTLSFNVTNLFNQVYVSEMGGEAGNAFQGDYESLLMGAPRQYFGTLKAAF